MAGLADRILGGEAVPYLSANDIRRVLDMTAYLTNGIVLSGTASTVSNVIYSSTNTAGHYYQYPTVYGDASFPPEPAKPRKPRKPKPESDMAWLERRVAEVSWVPA